MPDHERIWLEPECSRADPEGRTWANHPMDECPECGAAPTEYVRADLVAAERRAGWLAGRDAAARYLSEYVARTDQDDGGLIEAIADLTPPEVP